MLTATKTRQIAKELRRRVDTAGNLHIEELNGIALRNHVPLKAALSVAGDNQITVHGEMPKSRQAAAPKTLPLSDLVKRSIVNGTIFRGLPQSDGKPPGDDTYVMTTYGQFKRERKAILEWLREAGINVEDFK